MLSQCTCRTQRWGGVLKEGKSLVITEREMASADHRQMCRRAGKKAPARIEGPRADLRAEVHMSTSFREDTPEQNFASSSQKDRSPAEHICSRKEAKMPRRSAGRKWHLPDSLGSTWQGL